MPIGASDHYSSSGTDHIVDWELGACGVAWYSESHTRWTISRVHCSCLNAFIDFFLEFLWSKSLWKINPSQCGLGVECAWLLVASIIGSLCLLDLHALSCDRMVAVSCAGRCHLRLICLIWSRQVDVICWQWAENVVVTCYKMDMLVAIEGGFDSWCPGAEKLSNWMCE
jgi:hypothetical protein